MKTKNMQKVPIRMGRTPHEVYDSESFVDSFRVSKNREFLEMFPNDLVIECVDIKKMVESTRLRHEIERLKKVKVKLQSENDGIAKRDRNVIKFARNQESGILDMNAYNRNPNGVNHYMRPIKKIAPKFAKHFYLNVSLSYQYNQDFERVLAKFKNAMPSIDDGIYDVMCFTRIIVPSNRGNEDAKNMVIIYPELSFNNAFFPKETKYVLMGDGGLSHVLIWASNMFAKNRIANGRPDVKPQDNIVLLQHMRG